MIWIIVVVAALIVLLALAYFLSPARKTETEAASGRPAASWSVRFVNRMKAWFVSTDLAGRDQYNIMADTVCIQIIASETAATAREAAKLAARVPGDAEDPWSLHEDLKGLIWLVEDLKTKINARAVNQNVQPHLDSLVQQETEV